MLNRRAPQRRDRPDLIEVPPWVRETFDGYLVCEFTTVKSGKPVTLPLLPFYLPDSGKFVVTSSILFSKKAENVKQNPKVSLLFSNPEGSNAGKHAVLVQGIAHADDSDLDHGWEKYLSYWRKKEPYIDAYLAERDGKRVNVLFNHITGLPGGGYGDRRYMLVWGTTHEDHGTLRFEPEKVSEWDEKILPFDQYCAKSAPQGAKYLGGLQASVEA